MDLFCFQKYLFHKSVFCFSLSLLVPRLRTSLKSTFQLFVYVHVSYVSLMQRYRKLTDIRLKDSQFRSFRNHVSIDVNEDRRTLHNDQVTLKFYVAVIPKWQQLVSVGGWQLANITQLKISSQSLHLYGPKFTKMTAVIKMRPATNRTGSVCAIIQYTDHTMRSSFISSGITDTLLTEMFVCTDIILLQ